jgi:hypothetical protein
VYLIYNIYFNFSDNNNCAYAFGTLAVRDFTFFRILASAFGILAVKNTKIEQNLRFHAIFFAIRVEPKLRML